MFSSSSEDLDNTRVRSFFYELLSLKNIHCKRGNEEKIITLLENLQYGGKEELVIISDFDMTLTKEWVNGQRNISSHSLLTNSGFVSNRFKSRMAELLNFYFPYEKSTSIPLEEKEQKMEELWELSHDNYVEEKVTLNNIKQVVDKSEVVFRQGTDDLIKKSSRYNIPFLIHSAGLADVIEAILLNKGLLKDNIHIISNRMIFDQRSPHCIMGFKEPLIHLLNKGSVDIKEMSFYSALKNKRNVILLGDSLNDVQASNILDHDILIKIGFLNHKKTADYTKYLDVYDFIIVDDSDMEAVNRLFDWL